jgi:hypothetical protein
MGWKIHGQVTGRRMIEQGTDGIYRGDMMTGVMGRSDMLSFVLLALTAIERQYNLG